MKKLLQSVFVAALLLCGLSGNAASISLVPGNATLEVGDVVSMDVVLAFSPERALGGGLDIVWDPDVLTFESWTFDTSVVMSDPMFTRVGDVFEGLFESVVVGAFEGIEDGVMGTISFRAVGVGSTLVRMNDSGDPGPSWISADDFVTALNPQFNNATVSVVPLPAAAWLFVCALAWLGVVNRGGRFASRTGH